MASSWTCERNVFISTLQLVIEGPQTPLGACRQTCTSSLLRSNGPLGHGKGICLGPAGGHVELNLEMNWPWSDMKRTPRRGLQVDMAENTVGMQCP